jgi:hypothetical protein
MHTCLISFQFQTSLDAVSRNFKFDLVPKSSFLFTILYDENSQFNWTIRRKRIDEIFVFTRNASFKQMLTVNSVNVSIFVFFFILFYFAVTMQFADGYGSWVRKTSVIVDNWISLHVYENKNKFKKFMPDHIKITLIRWTSADISHWDVSITYTK